MSAAMRNSHSIPRSPQRQRGAVLYVALIMLILLALIGVVGLQVSGLQERMSANYRNANLAFQMAELEARQTEAIIETALSGGTGTFTSNQEYCAPIFDPLTWADGVDTENAVYTRRIDKCFAASSLKVGAKQNEETGNIYEISALSTDETGNSTASAVINTIFIP